MTLPVSYAWYPGWNALDASLVLVSEDLSPYTLPSMAVTVTPRSGLVNTFPIRSLPLSGSERGDGMVMLTPGNGAWNINGLAIAALQYIQSHYFSGGTVTSVPMTIATHRYEVSNAMYKANVYMQLPIQGVDFTYDSLFALGLNIRFGDYIQL